MGPTALTLGVPPRASRIAAPRQSAPAAEVHHPGRTSFVLMIVGMLTVGLAALLGVNTALAQNSFTVNALQRHSGALTDQATTLAEALARANSPERLAADARRLGMAPAPGVSYVRLADASISGVGDFAAGDPVPVTPEQSFVMQRQAEEAKSAAEAEQAKADAKVAAARAKAEAKAAAERAKAQAQAAAEAEAARLAAERAAAQAAADKAAAAAKAWQDKLAAQDRAGPKAGGAMLVAPPEGTPR